MVFDRSIVKVKMKVVNKTAHGNVFKPKSIDRMIIVKIYKMYFYYCVLKKHLR